MHQKPRDAVLVIGFASSSGGVATRLIALGFRPISVSHLQAAAERLDREPVPLRAAIVPTEAEFLAAGALWRLTRLKGLNSLRCIALGPRVDAAGAARLSGAGVHFPVWEPCTDRTLRFAVNRAIHGEQHQNRRRARTATDLVARASMGTRAKAGIVYSLSPDGCYVETDRPFQPETSISLNLPLPNGGMELPARVLYANVPGNFDRSNLPHGMALAFDGIGSEQRAAIAAYVDTRLADQGVEPRSDEVLVRGAMARVWARLRTRIAPRPSHATS